MGKHADKWIFKSCLLGVVLLLDYCSALLLWFSGAAEFCRGLKRRNHVVKHTLIGSDPIFSKRWQIVVVLQRSGALSGRPPL